MQGLYPNGNGTKKDTLVIMTGGTIDAEPYGNVTPENIIPLDYSLVPRAAAALTHNDGSLADNCEFVQFDMSGEHAKKKQGSDKHYGMKDSKFFTDRDFRQLVAKIEDPKNDYRNIVITFGTDRMPEIAQRLKEALEGLDKKIIVTGAMTPLSHALNADGSFNMDKSDGFANLKKALTEVKAQQRYGVYVVMNKGQLFKPDELDALYKDFDNKEFRVAETSKLSIPGR